MMKIHYVKTIGGHPVQRFLMQAVVHEEDNGFVSSSRVTYPSYDFECIFVIGHGDERIRAAMSFERLPHVRAFKINFSFVAPEFRRQGYHTALFNKLVGMAMRDGYLRINRYVHGENKEMIAAIQKQGCDLTGRSFGFVVPFDHYPTSTTDRFEA